MNIFLFIRSNICLGCSKEPSHWDGSFEYQQYMFWLRNKCFLIIYVICRPGLKVIKLVSCSTQLSMKVQLIIKAKMLKKIDWLVGVFIQLINFKMPTIVGILTFMSWINFVLSWVWHEKSFITLGPGLIGYNDLLKAGTVLNFSMRMLIVNRNPRNCNHARLIAEFWATS